MSHNTGQLLFLHINLILFVSSRAHAYQQPACPLATPRRSTFARVRQCRSRELEPARPIARGWEVTTLSRGCVGGGRGGTRYDRSPDNDAKCSPSRDSPRSNRVVAAHFRVQGHGTGSTSAWLKLHVAHFCPAFSPSLLACYDFMLYIV